jgi:hypothetical protein
MYSELILALKESTIDSMLKNNKNSTPDQRGSGDSSVLISPNSENNMKLAICSMDSFKSISKL